MRIVCAAVLALSPVAASAQQFFTCPGLMPQNITCEGGKSWNARYQACM